MKYGKLPAVFAVICGISLAASGKDFVLVKDGKMLPALHKPKGCSEETLDAIREFSYAVERCTGDRNPLLRKGGGPRIIFVERPAPVQLLDRYFITFPEKNTMRIIGTKASIKFALTHILEKYFSVRYLMKYNLYFMKLPLDFTSEVATEYPRIRDVRIPRKNVVGHASFNLGRKYGFQDNEEWFCRDVFPRHHGMTEDVFPWQKYAPDNSWPQEILPIHSNGKRYVMPKHQKRLGGRQYFARWQPCYSNPETVKIAVRDILENIRKYPMDPGYFDAHIKKYDNGEKRYFVNMDPNDNSGYCRCEKCLKAVNKKRNKIGRSNYSDLYYAWVNAVAKEVTKVYPDFYFTVLAYTEVYDPPSFKLHPNVVVTLCRELYSGVKPDIRKDIESTLKGWNAKANHLRIWDYLYGSECFLIPRIQLQTQSDMLKLCYKYGVRGFINEVTDTYCFDGPKNYINAKQMWDVNTDVYAHLKDWCVASVGKEASPYLLAYWKFWDEYWKSAELLKTPWATSLYSTYAQLGENGTYTYALKKGDMKKLRSLLENMVAKSASGSAAQQKRARLYLRIFSVSETAVKALYSEILEADGTVRNAAEARLLLEQVPAALQAVHDLEEMAKKKYAGSNLVSIVRRGMESNLTAVNPYLKDPAIQKQIRTLLKRKDLPLSMQGMFRIMLGYAYKNHVENGSFEDAKKSPVPYFRGKDAHNTERVSHGKYSFKSLNGNCFFVVKNIIPGKTYFAMMDVYIANSSGEGLLTFELAPRDEKNITLDWMSLRNVKLQKGWQTLSFSYKVPLKGYTRRAPSNILLRANCRNFELDEPVWMDNVRLYQLD